LTAVCFVATVASLDGLRAERFALFQAGLSPVDWMRMPRWQRLDLLLRHRRYAKREMDRLKAAARQGGKKKNKGFAAFLGLVVRRMLGV